jgi:hypothetical protein
MADRDTKAHRSRPTPAPAETIARWLRLLVDPGQVVELRAPKVRLKYGRPCTFSGYFDHEHLDDLAREAVRLTADAPGVYVTLNPVHPDLLARRCNRVDRAEEGETTADKHIVCRRWLLVDCDPVRDSYISATGEEKAAAYDVALKVRDHLRSRGWPDPLLIDSGNGYHLLYRIDLPTDDKGLVAGVLRALAALFDAEAVHIDQKVCNPARITKLPGSLAKKGDHTEGRPHRRSELLEVPGCADPEQPDEARVETVPLELLKALAGEAPAEGPHPPSPGGPARQAPHASDGHTSNGVGQTGNGFAWDDGLDRRLNVPRWLAARGVRFRQKEGKGTRGETVYVLDVCPFNPDHGTDACITQEADGRPGAQCFRNGCVGRNWHTFREAIGKPDNDHWDPPIPPRPKRGQKERGPKRDAAGANGPAGPDGPDEAACPGDGATHLTDRGNGVRLARRHGRDLRYCHPHAEVVRLGLVPLAGGRHRRADAPRQGHAGQPLRGGPGGGEGGPAGVEGFER